MFRWLAPSALTLLVAACALNAPKADHHDYGDEPLGTTQSALEATDPVSMAIDASCTTSSVKGFATQLIDEIQCLRPGTLASIETDPGFSLGNAVFPWLQTPARTALLAAQKQRNVTMTINSALRTLPQQYLLYRWYKTGRCGIGLAAAPGNSNHESAVAVDIDDNAAWRVAMGAHDFVWLGASDPVHFDFKGEGVVEIGGLSVLAFQWWNRNHPEDILDEDSDYGPATEERLAKSPVGGFAKGADCSAPVTTPPPAGTSTPVPSGGSASDAGKSGLGTAGSRGDSDAVGCSIGASSARPANALWLVAASLAYAVRRRRRNA